MGLGWDGLGMGLGLGLGWGFYGTGRDLHVMRCGALEWEVKLEIGQCDSTTGISLGNDKSACRFSGTCVKLICNTCAANDNHYEIGWTC